VLGELRDQPPADLAGEAIVRTQVLTTNDGFKWFLADGSWLLVRASGTEPLVRVYTEASSPALRDELVVTGERVVRGG
jgi:phosphomannomutase